MLVGSNAAYGIEAFKKEFVALYVKADSADAGDQAFAAAVKKANCNVCHVGAKKKDRNEYGKALDELLDKKADAKDSEKIKAALEKVAGMKSNPADASSPTFGDLIKEHKLPGGDAPAAAAAGN
jgi:hypothetical protein